MRTHLFKIVLTALNHWFGVDAVEAGDEFSVNCVSNIVFVNNVYSKFDNFSNFVFYCEKTKLGIQRSVSVSFFKCQKTAFLKLIFLKILF